MACRGSSRNDVSTSNALSWAMLVLGFVFSPRLRERAVICARIEWRKELMHVRAILLLTLAAGFFGPEAAALTVLSYNVSGNGAADWSTNSVQVQAIGRQVASL